MSIALAAMAETFIANANAAGIPMEVLHRVAAMASGGMDTLPHNGAVITPAGAVTGLTHRDRAYKDIFANCSPPCIKTRWMAVFVVIGWPVLRARNPRGQYPHGADPARARSRAGGRSG
jgi:H+/gluconate symporter-like permease